MIETWGGPPEKPDVKPDSFQQSIESACIHNVGGYCAFLLSEFLDPETRQPCRLCPQWASGKAEWKAKLHIPYKQGVAKFLDLIRLNPSLAKMYGLKPLKKDVRQGGSLTRLKSGAGQETEDHELRSD